MHPCCENPDNLTDPVPVDGRKDLVVRVCKTCGRRHLELTVDPLNLTIVGH